jgi:hypothetical protein
MQLVAKPAPRVSGDSVTDRIERPCSEHEILGRRFQALFSLRETQG